MFATCFGCQRESQTYSVDRELSVIHLALNRSPLPHFGYGISQIFNKSPMDRPLANGGFIRIQIRQGRCHQQCLRRC